MVQTGGVQQRGHWHKNQARFRGRGLEYTHASDASSASLNLPGKIHVTERSEDSRLEMTETLFTRKDSYLAKADDITGMCANGTEPTVCGRLCQSFVRKPGGRRGLWWVWGAACDNPTAARSGHGFATHPLFRSAVWPGQGRTTLSTFDAILTHTRRLREALAPNHDHPASIFPTKPCPRPTGTTRRDHQTGVEVPPMHRHPK